MRGIYYHIGLRNTTQKEYFVQKKNSLEYSGHYFKKINIKFQEVFNKLEKNSFGGTISESQKIYDDDFFELLKLWSGEQGP